MCKFSTIFLLFCCCFSKHAAFHSSKRLEENLLHEQAAIPDTNHELVKRRANDTKESTDNQDGDQHNNSHSNKTAIATNDTDHHGADQGHHGVKHHGIHLASWNFDHVQGPLIIAVFLLTAGIAKLG